VFRHDNYGGLRPDTWPMGRVLTEFPGAPQGQIGAVGQALVRAFPRLNFVKKKPWIPYGILTRFFVTNAKPHF
jgi:hypothetical protein